jgi:FecR-like protein
VFGRIFGFCAPVFLAGFVISYPGSQVAAEDTAAWRVTKSSGQVWMMTAGVQEASLTSEAALKPGDTIRTGSNGRVLLVRGEASMLIAPNSVIALPAEQKDGLSTTIYEQAGSVLVHADKRNFKHFQVETPYLAAVVKGTQFRVTLDKRGANVAVLGGQVEVTDFKTGQNALVLPGQGARVSATGQGGLSLNGPGVGPVNKGTPRPSPFDQIRVPKGGFAMPAGSSDGKTVHVLGAVDLASNSHVNVGQEKHEKNVVRITAPLGDVTLDFVKATDGLAHGAIVTPADRDNGSRQTVWSNGDLTPGNGAAKSAGQASNSNAVAAAVSNAGGNGNGNANGIGNGAANGLGNGNGAANSLAVGNGNGNGNGFGLGKGKGKP